MNRILCSICRSEEAETECKCNGTSQYFCVNHQTDHLKILREHIIKPIKKPIDSNNKKALIIKFIELKSYSSHQKSLLTTFFYNEVKLLEAKVKKTFSKIIEFEKYIDNYIASLLVIKTIQLKDKTTFLEYCLQDSSVISHLTKEIYPTLSLSSYLISYSSQSIQSKL